MGVSEVPPASGQLVAVRDCPRARDGRKIPSSCSAGIDLLVPAVAGRAGTARKAESRLAAAPPLDASSTLPGRALTGRAPCYPAERPGRSSAWRCSASKRFSFAIHRWASWRYAERWPRAPRQRALPAWAETAAAGSVARPLRPRDSTRPEPAGRGGRPNTEEGITRAM
jgi:hypothetical protein